MNRKPLTLTIAREGYKSASITLQPVDVVADRVLPFWHDSSITEDTMACPADSVVGRKIIELCGAADVLLALCNESDVRDSIIDAVVGQANVWYHG